VSRGKFVVLVFLVLVIGLGYLGSKYSRGPITLAAYSDAGGLPFEVMDASVLLEPGIGTGVWMHETHHAFRRFGLIDYDVPTAAALGYVVEWSQVGSLSDIYRLPAFKDGLANPSADAKAILRRYAGEQEAEPVSAYDDGARLAGIALRVCGGTQGGGVRYIFGVSMGLPHERAVELCWHPTAFSIVSSLRSGSYLYFDEDLLARESARINLTCARAKLLKSVTEFLGSNYRLTFWRKERLATIDALEPNLIMWLMRRKQVGLDLEDHPAALAFQFYQEWAQNGKPVDSDLKVLYRLGLNSTDATGGALLKKASIEGTALRRDAATLAGLIERTFGEDSAGAWRYTQMATLGLSHVLAVAIARDEELFHLVCKVRDGGFSTLDQERLEDDLARVDSVSRAAVLRYVKQLSSEYEIRYIQPALNGKQSIPDDIHGACVPDIKTACLLNRFRVRVRWASVATPTSDFAVATSTSSTSAAFVVGGAAVKISVTNKGDQGVDCRILGGRSKYTYSIEIVDIKEKWTRAWQGYSGVDLDTGLFLLSDS
jgi:hypothetical protein